MTNTAEFYACVLIPEIPEISQNTSGLQIQTYNIVKCRVQLNKRNKKLRY